MNEEFWLRVDRSAGLDACWPWTGTRSASGYGRFRVYDPVWRTATRVQAHRLALAAVLGPIPEDLLVCHHCDNPPCCNPLHLFAGTHDDNMQDKRAKGRGRSGLYGRTSEALRAEIRRLSATGIPDAEVASLTGVSHMTVSRVRRNII